MRTTLLLLIAASISFIYSTVSYAASWKTESAGGFSVVHVYAPDSKSPVGDGRALMINLHGCTQTAAALKGANWDEVADEYGMVVALPEAQYKAGFSCWGYWTGGISRTSGDYANVINLAKALIERSSLDIDPNQVYVSGLSSGGAFAMTVGCLAPDIFAGMGLDAAPSAGTSSGEAMGVKGSTVQQTAQRCMSYAGSYSDYFDTQVTSTGYGTSDYLVHTGYALQNAEAMASIYGVTKKPGTNTIATGVTETLWTDNRVSMLSFSGVGHAWPGGSGASGSYVDGSSINYGMYLAEFFAQNNPRIEGLVVDDYRPELSEVSVDSSDPAAGITISGNVYIKEGTSLTSVTVEVGGKSYSGQLDGFYSVEVDLASNAEYSVTVTAVAIDGEGQEHSSSESTSFTLGTVAQPPAWCVYIPSGSLQYFPQCTPGSTPQIPSWCTYIPEPTRSSLSACNP